MDETVIGILQEAKKRAEANLDWAVEDLRKIERTLGNARERKQRVQAELESIAKALSEAGVSQEA